MKNKILFTGLMLIIALSFLNFNSVVSKVTCRSEKLHFPFRSQGLSERQAAAHLLSRFTYGATPGQVDEVVKLGVENWFLQQLEGGLPDDKLNEKLAGYHFLKLTNEQVDKTFPRPSRLLKMAIEDGIIPKDSVGTIERQDQRAKLKEYLATKNLHQQGELIREFISQRILRARYSNNQMQEVLAGFWFNHFNVSLAKPQVLQLILSYERDVIRTHVAGRFGELLQATAESPAMLVYLDNFTSAKEADAAERQKMELSIKSLEERNSISYDSSVAARISRLKKLNTNKGLNENYARELMELHTLGVDGGYTQSDVTEAARILTGWTIYPFGEGYSVGMKKVLEKIGDENLAEKGYIHKGDFLFAANRHDLGPKTVLGRAFPADHGYDEGEALLQMLAHHPATAKFISSKLATYFVSDQPPKSLVEKMARTFLEKDGEITSVLITMVNAPEFWSQQSVRQKTKSPFEYVISAARALESEVSEPYQLFLKMDKMGQKIYYFQAPTGFPDRSNYWINTGSLLNRMNFGMDIASNSLKGIYTDLLKLNNNNEPENSQAALHTFANLILPERQLDVTIKRLAPLLSRPDYKDRVYEAANKHADAGKMTGVKGNDMDLFPIDNEGSDSRKIQTTWMQSSDLLAQVVGIIIGSPEFQRR